MNNAREHGATVAVHYVAALARLGKHDDPGHLPAADRRRHGQGAVSQLRVVMLRANPSTRREATSSTEARWSLPSPVGISVPSPYYLTLTYCAGKSRLTRSGARHRPLPGRVVALRFFFRRAARPSSRITAATVFLLIAQPSSRRSAVASQRHHPQYRASGNSRRSSGPSYHPRARRHQHCSRGCDVPGIPPRGIRYRRLLRLALRTVLICRCSPAPWPRTNWSSATS